MSWCNETNVGKQTKKNARRCMCTVLTRFPLVSCTVTSTTNLTKNKKINNTPSNHSRQDRVLYKAARRRNTNSVAPHASIVHVICSASPQDPKQLPGTRYLVKINVLSMILYSTSLGCCHCQAIGRTSRARPPVPAPEVRGKSWRRRQHTSCVRRRTTSCVRRNIRFVTTADVSHNTA